MNTNNWFDSKQGRLAVADVAYVQYLQQIKNSGNHRGGVNLWSIIWMISVVLLIVHAV